MKAEKLVSIIINNYNYGRYLDESISSVLGQTYKKIELIVVDDGSTDNSREILNKYESKIVLIEKANGGQGSAYNAGIEKVKGEIILFLDADDYLLPKAVEEIVSVFTERTAKVQFRLSIVDSMNIISNQKVPSGKMTSGNLVSLLLQFGSYGSPPASGNAYSAKVVKTVYPIDERMWVIAADTVPAVYAPFIGDVQSINKSSAEKQKILKMRL